MERGGLKLTIDPPIFLVGMKTSCWKCEARTPVVTLIAGTVHEFEGEVCLLSYIRVLPPELLTFVKQKVPTFKMKYSNTAEEEYYANTCTKCGAILGDYFLHSEPAGPFFPTTEEAEKLLYQIEVPLSTQISIEANVGIGTGEMILNNAKRL